VAVSQLIYDGPRGNVVVSQDEQGMEPKVCHFPNDLVFVVVLGGEHDFARLLSHLFQHPVLAGAEQLGRVGALRIAGFSILDDSVELGKAELGRSSAGGAPRLGEKPREEA